MNDTPAAH
ncbi:hypothetical protein E2C01_068748 [Portunus trituberculatus]|uniref:Uncharacterized protein n=1 Tax=Portunus trituberculatus TaxID=210409 RepID=A0A5B7HPM1_PORTR|nr:hypothetical protein [Portunus trituberculatus]